MSSRQTVSQNTPSTPQVGVGRFAQVSVNDWSSAIHHDADTASISLQALREGALHLNAPSEVRAALDTAQRAVAQVRDALTARAEEQGRALFAGLSEVQEAAARSHYEYVRREEALLVVIQRALEELHKKATSSARASFSGEVFPCLKPKQPLAAFYHSRGYAISQALASVARCAEGSALAVTRSHELVTYARRAKNLALLDAALEAKEAERHKAAERRAVEEQKP